MSPVIKDNNFIPKYKDMIDELMNNKVYIGIFGSKGSEILMIASVNEFGCEIDVTPKMRGYLHRIGIDLKKSTTTIKIPERSFIRGGFDEKVNGFYSQMKILLKHVLSLNLSPKVFYNTLGEHIVGELQEYLIQLKEPSNHHVTIERKGSDNPLIDTGRLKDAITYKVVKS